MSEPQGSENTTRRMPVLEKPDAGPPAEDELGQSASAADYDPPPAVDDASGGRGRFWSVRRVPAGIVALLVLVGAGVLLYDVAAVRAHRPASHWRGSLVRQLAERPLDDTWVLVGAGLAAVLGLWLIVLAVTPGLRDVLPMRRTHPDVRAGLHRSAAATALRDRAMEVSGVRSVRVRMGRRKVDVRAVSHFRALDDVRADLDATLADGIRGLGLVRTPALSVHVARPGRKG
ncbi:MULTISPECIES: DUF6286 domain-containing protein [Streptomyces]|uniref:DUF6286 domain-containing protein n=1 Tax=Streptomyces mirabilis TaxID=68239 RepID=A0ABU3UWR3_9ACTN|nr:MULTISPECIES: DUF6286 domain-containing protein [Streptomyces]MCX4607795.1 alkaline shock response membrane anchor protein AmaP [Streptomyces mirabilis]MCX5348258.1 alkaline shock response membrane anchor protein AmaP [Streptomyces mirabilis]MDU8998382.1 DUF6286 domain-containing protein [Streptomyces mirabilis]QDN86869.1 hypothetical protein FNV61_15685 [Streptomyces sp. RLB3-6]QDO07681.1 hypothetical protein FNV68_16785 [Streptomyces sp. S1D4-23]